MAQEGLVNYHIIVKGALDPSWTAWLSGLKLTTAIAADGSCITILSGPIPDQAALRGILTRIWDLNLELVALFRNHDSTNLPS